MILSLPRHGVHRQRARATTKKMKILKADSLKYSYAKDLAPALDDVSFDIEEGTYTAIIGHNGSGKSTLAKLIMGLLSGFEGTIEVFGKELNKKNLFEIRSRIGIVFQNPDNQFVGSTVADDIAFGLENKQVPHEEMQGIIERYAAESGMAEFLDHEPQNLSGGQKQRVAIAGVLAMQPDLVIFDEATAMLDPKGKAEIRALITKMKTENPGLTILSITHDIEEAANSDQVIVLNEGKLILSGTPEKVFSHEERLKEVRLDIPFVFSLKSSLAQKGFKVPENIKTIGDLEEFLCL